MREELKQWIDYITVFMYAVCITVALFADVKSTGNLSMALNGTGVTQWIAFLFICMIIVRCKDYLKNTEISGRSKIFYAALAALFAIFMIIGKSQEAHEDLKFIIFAIPMFIGYFVMFDGLLALMDLKILSQIPTWEIKLPNRLSEWVFEKHTVIAPMLTVWLFRLPWLISFFPCTISWDGAIQIRNFYGRELFTNHHPPLVSFLYGNIAWHSNQAGIDNIGMFMIPVIQVLISSFAVAKTCEFLKKLKTPYWMRWGALLFYAAFSVWCIFDCTIIKDTLYYPFVLLFSLKVMECLLEEEAFWKGKRNLFLLFFYAIMMTQIRNNGIFVLLFTVPLLLFAVKRARKIMLLIMLLLSLTGVWTVEHIVYPSFGVINLEEKVDTYCIMFQQTAKYSIEHPEDVTQEEREILDQLFDYDELARVYNPRLADWVKNCLRVQEGIESDPTNSTFANLKDEYFRVWFAQLCRHPLTYVKAFFECSYGYYYPELRVYKEGYGIYDFSHDLLTKRMSDISQIEALGKARFLLEQIDKLEYMPGVGMLYRCGFYTWVLLGIMMYLGLKKRYKALIACVPPFVNVLICLISPVNTCIRYAMPTMCMIPVLLAWLWYQYAAKGNNT